MKIDRSNYLALHSTYFQVAIFGYLLLLSNLGMSDDRWLSGGLPNTKQQELAQKFVHAVNEKKVYKLRALYYLPSMQCNERHFDADLSSIQKLIIESDLEQDIAIDYQVSVSPYVPYESEFEKKFGGSIVEYVVNPSHELNIGYLTKSGGGVISRHIVEIDNNWYFLFGCPGLGYREFLKLVERQKSAVN